MSSVTHLRATPRACTSPPGLVLRFWDGRRATSPHLKALSACLSLSGSLPGPQSLRLRPPPFCTEPSIQVSLESPTHPSPAKGDSFSCPLMRALLAAGGTCIHPLQGTLGLPVVASEDLRMRISGLPMNQEPHRASSSKKAQYCPACDYWLVRLVLLKAMDFHHAGMFVFVVVLIFFSFLRQSFSV